MATPTSGDPGAMSGNGAPIGADLTPREREVLAMVAAGMTNREIGAALFISESTAGVHVSNLMAKLGVLSRTEAASVAYRAGLVESVAAAPAAETSAAETSAAEPHPAGRWGRLSWNFQQQLEHHPRRVAAAGVGGLAVLFLITGGLAMAVLGEAPAAGGADPTATARPSVRPSPTASPSPTAEPSPTRTPIPIGGADVHLEVDGLAEILVDDLILRAEPGTGALRIGQLPGRATAFVAAGPVTEDGFAWYRLAAVDPFGVGCGTPQPPESLACRDWFGWAAAGGLDGEDWLAPVDPACPEPGNPAALMGLLPLEGLSCFGSTPMALRMYVSANSGTDGCGPGAIEPAWLGSPCATVPLEDAESVYPEGNALLVSVSPDIGSCWLETGPNCPLTSFQGRWVRVSVHYDDPAAASCAVRSGLFGASDPDAVVLACRGALVMQTISADDGLGSLDQAQQAWVPQSPVGYQPHVVGSAFYSGIAQTFRAGRTGELTVIQLSLSRLPGTSGPLVVQIRRGDPDGELLATSPATNWTDLPIDPGSCIPPQCLALNREYAWVTIRFDSPAHVTAGETYAVVLPPGPITGSADPAFLVASSTANAYANGVVWGHGPIEGDAWQSYVSGQDLAFRTIVR